MTVIITDTHYRMALALIRDLGENGVTVVGCEYEDEPFDVGSASVYVSKKHTLSRDNTLTDITDICRKYISGGELPALIPVGASTQLLLSENADKLSGICRTALPTPEALSLFNDKRAVGERADALSIPTPRCYSEDELDTAPLPLVVKPACGEKFGLKAEDRYRIVHTRDELNDSVEHYRKITGSFPLVQQRLVGGGCGCSALLREGEVLAHICHRRIREYPVSGGPSTCSVSFDDDDMLGAVKKFAAGTGYTGVAMFEFKAHTDGKKYLLEINPRVWGTYPLTRVSGSNFSVMWYCLAAGLDIPEPAPAENAKMVYYPSDLLAALGYMRKGRITTALGSLRDLFSSNAKNGMREKGDPEPYRVYKRSLLRRGGRK